MASLQPSSVSNIMKALNELEEKIDSLNTKVADMKKNLNQKANAQSQSITQEGDGKITELQSKIDATFDDAVKHVVSTVLKA